MLTCRVQWGHQKCATLHVRHAGNLQMQHACVLQMHCVSRQHKLNAWGRVFGYSFEQNMEFYQCSGGVER
jgi:hypothetical protein